MIKLFSKSRIVKNICLKPFEESNFGACKNVGIILISNGLLDNFLIIFLVKTIAFSLEIQLIIELCLT